MIASLTFWHRKRKLFPRQEKREQRLLSFCSGGRRNLPSYNCSVWFYINTTVAEPGNALSSFQKKKKQEKTNKASNSVSRLSLRLIFFSNWFPVELARDQRWRVGDETRFSFHPPHWENNKYPFTLAERKRKGNHGNTFLFLLFSPQSFPWPDFIQATRWCWDFYTKPFDIAGRKKDAVTANNPQKRGRWLAMVIITAQARRVAWRARGGDNDRRKSSWWNQSWRKVIGRRLDGEERWRWSTRWREHELMARWNDFKCANV